MERKYLTPREYEIFAMLVKDLTTKEIAAKLRISAKTVYNHVSNVIQKLGVKTRAQAIIELVKSNQLKL